MKTSVGIRDTSNQIKKYEISPFLAKDTKNQTNSKLFSLFSHKSVIKNLKNPNNNFLPKIIISPFRHPVIPLSRHPVIPKNRYPIIPLSRYPEKSSFRYPIIPKNRHP